MTRALQARTRLAAGDYALAAGGVAVAAALRWALAPALGTEFPLIFFLPPIVVAAWRSGLRLGLLTTAAGCGIGIALFIPQVFSGALMAIDGVRISLFLVTGAVVSWLVTSSKLGWLHADKTERATEQRLRSEHERTVRILESIGDAFYALDADFRFTYVNRKAEQLWGKPRESLLGRRIWDEFPQAVGTLPYDMHREVVRELRPVQFETRSPVLGAWLDVSLYPDTNGGIA
jgi:PAS domain-containing protein